MVYLFIPQLLSFVIIVGLHSLYTHRIRKQLEYDEELEKVDREFQKTTTDLMLNNEIDGSPLDEHEGDIFWDPDKGPLGDWKLDI